MEATTARALDVSALKALHTLAAVHQRGGFAAAGRALGVTRAAVSRAVASLEAKLGVRLARRTTRKVVLSEAGIALAEQCGAALDSVSLALENAREREASLAGVIRVAGPLAFGRDALVPLVLEFQRAHPQVSIDLSLSDGLHDLVDRPIDVAVRLGPLPETSLVARRVGSLPLVVVATPALVRAHGAPRSVDDLARVPAVRFRVPATGKPFVWRFDEGGRARQWEPASAALETDSVDALVTMVRSGAGASLLPRHLVESELASGRLVELLEGVTSDGPLVHICYGARSFMPRRVRAFVDLLARELPAFCKSTKPARPKRAARTKRTAR
ncbi:MAG: LysR family transcriptional regulator [Polyangiaceae bacterium]